MNNFVDAQEMAKSHPDSFEAPNKKELDTLKSGDIVKVCHSDERFWAVVKEVDGDKITATVDNDLVLVEEFNCGDDVEFEKRHIYAIWEDV